MFYIKTEDGEKVEIDDEIYTNCVYCGKKIVVDSENIDLSAYYSCENCEEETANEQKTNSEWKGFYYVRFNAKR